MTLREWAEVAGWAALVAVAVIALDRSIRPKP